MKAEWLRRAFPWASERNFLGVKCEYRRRLGGFEGRLARALGNGMMPALPTGVFRKIGLSAAQIEA